MTRGDYPGARRSPLIETMHGVDVADPYRWLEEDASDETRAWVEAQNALTRSELDGPGRDALIARLRGVYDYPRTLSLIGRGGRLFFTHNPGRLDQPILYVRDALDAEPRVLIDPNTLSDDGTTALTAYAVSPDGTHIAYALSEHGSDRQAIAVAEVQEVLGVRKVLVLEDRLEFVKFASIAWISDGQRLLLSAVPRTRQRSAGRRAVLRPDLFPSPGHGPAWRSTRVRARRPRGRSRRPGAAF